MQDWKKTIANLMSGFGNVDFDAFPQAAPFEDADVISAYSRAEAIEDGVLIDVSEAARDIGITLHTVVTPGVWSEFVGAPIFSDWGTENHRLKQLLNCAVRAVERSDDSVSFFSIEMARNESVVKEIAFRVQRGPGDNLEPVLTVMLRHED
ncbi:MAG: DUF6573 family protein [Pirellula sp.]